MDKDLKALLKKPHLEWSKKDEVLYQKLTKKRAKMTMVQTTPVDEMSEGDLNDLKHDAPRKKMVVLPKDESARTTLPGAEPYIYKVKKGDTLNKIATMFSVSYSELSDYLLGKEGNTVLYIGQEIQIPRHFIDITQA